MSHNPGDLDEWLITQMARQLKIQKNDFVEVLNCSIQAGSQLENGVVAYKLRKKISAN